VRRGDATTDRVVTRDFATLFGANFAFFTAGGMLTPVLGRYVRNELDGSETEIGFAFGAYALGAVVVRPLAGRIGDRLGRRLPLVVGALIFASSVLLYGPGGRAGGAFAVVLVRILSGGAGAAVYVCTTAVATDAAPAARRGEAISLFSVSVFAGAALGPPIGEFLLHHSGFGAVWVAASITGFVCAGLGVLVRDPRTLTATTGAERPRQPFVHPAAVGPGLVICLGAVGLATWTSFIAVYSDEIGMDRVAPALLLFALVTVACRVFGARLNDRVPRRVMAMWSVLASGSALYLVAALDRPAGVYLGAVLLASGMSFMYPTFVLMAVDAAADHERGAVVGTLTAFTDVSNAIGGLALGQVADHTSYRGAFATAGGIISAAFVLLLLGIGVPRPQRTATAPVR
jgi:MFS family permease